MKNNIDPINHFAWEFLGIIKVQKQDPIPVQSRRRGQPLYILPNPFPCLNEDETWSKTLSLSTSRNLFQVISKLNGKLIISNIPLFTHRIIIFGLQNIQDFNGLLQIPNRDKLLREVLKQAEKRKSEIKDQTTLQHLNKSVQGVEKFCKT